MRLYTCVLWSRDWNMYTLTRSMEFINNSQLTLITMIHDFLHKTEHVGKNSVH